MNGYLNNYYGNAASSHLFGLMANEAVHDGRENTAAIIGAKASEIIFTSGATEAINLAVKGLATKDSTRRHIVTVKTEHKAVLDTLNYLENKGFAVTYVDVNADGMVDLDRLRDAVTTQTLIVCIMLANNETGVINPIIEMIQIAHGKGALFMTDATQAVGKIPVNVNTLNVDLLAFSAHKFYGPKGAGALYINRKSKIKLDALLHGGGHERKLRSGTLNVPAICGMGKACEIALNEMDDDAIRIGQLRDRLEIGLLTIDHTFVNGITIDRLYNTTNICFRGINAETLIMALQYISVSGGSACSAVSTTPSHVLKAMGLSDDDALASIRFSLGKFTTHEEIETAIIKVTQLVEQIRAGNV